MGTTSMIKVGRPTKYSKSVCARVMNYVKNTSSKGDFPSVEGLALDLGVGTRTLYDWEKLYSEFSQTMEHLRDAQRKLLISNGLNNKYNARFAAFLLKAIHGLSDTKPLFEATQNNYMDVSPEILAEALKIMAAEDAKKLS